MKRAFRLTSSTDFKRVRQDGKSFAHPLVVLIAARGESEVTRIGVAAGRAVGGAVQRNRAKRRLRAGLDKLYPSIGPGWNVIILARFPLLGAGPLELNRALVNLLERAGLLKQPVRHSDDAT